MSATIDEKREMINAKYRVDIEIDSDQEKTNFCSFTKTNNVVEYAISNGNEVLICDGLSEKRNILKGFQMEFTVQKLFYHVFENSKNTDKKEATENANVENVKQSMKMQREFLIVFGENRLVFVDTNEDMFYHYDIPFKPRNIFAVSGGLLIERFYDASNDNSYHRHETFHLYSLSGPFGELLPVIHKSSDFKKKWKFCWQSLDDAEIVGSAGNFVVVYDPKHHVHRIYMTRETEEKDVRSAIEYVENQRRKLNDTTFCATNQEKPRFADDVISTQSARSPAVIALSELIESKIENASPQQLKGTSSTLAFGHSTPNNLVGNFQSPLPTPIYDGGNDRQWTPSPFSQVTPRMSTNYGNSKLERNIHKRSIARMTNADDNNMPSTVGQSPFGNSNPPTTLTCTPKLFHQNRVFHRTSDACLVRNFTRMIRDTPKNPQRRMDKTKPHIEYGELDREPDLDLLLSKVCMECVYVEPKEKATCRADRVFLSRFLGQSYLNIVSHEGKSLMIIPVWKDAPKTELKLGKNGDEIISIMECRDAVDIVSDGLTVVLEMSNFLSIYGGQRKISMVFAQNQNLELTENSRLYPFEENSFCVLHGNIMTRIGLPKAYESPIVGDVLRACFRHLPRSCAEKMACAWRSTPRDCNQSDLCGNFQKNEIVKMFMFILNQMGIYINESGGGVECDSPEAGGKQRKPRKNVSDVLKRAHQVADGMECDETQRRTIEVNVENKPEFGENVRTVFLAIHALQEEWNIIKWKQYLLELSVPYMYLLAKILKEDAFIAYYDRLYGNITKGINYVLPANVHLKTFAQPLQPLSIIKLVEAGWRGDEGIVDKMIVCPYITPLCARILVVSIIANNFTNVDFSKWLGRDWSKVIGVSREVRLKLNKIIKNNSLTMPERVSKYVDILKIDATIKLSLIAGVKIGYLKRISEASAGLKVFLPNEYAFPSADENQMINSARWPHDIRIRNAEMMLDSSKPVLIASNVLGVTDDILHKDAQDRFLMSSSLRYFAQPFGRALIGFRSAVPSLLEALEIPRMALTGVIYPARVVCDPINNESYRLYAEFADFYNSVATALQIGSNDMVKIENEWILMVSKNTKTVQSSAGLILGFGLNGHLGNMNMYHANKMLDSFEKFQSCALLLGMAASKYRTCDTQIYKILATYLQFLMGPTLMEIKIHCTIQTAAISALGLLFADSGNMNIAKKLTNEIGRAPNTEDEPVVDRVAYRLSAGFSLGLIMLGRGNGIGSSSVPFKQMVPSLSERLLVMMKGGLKKSCVFLPQQAGQGADMNSNFASNYAQTSGHVPNHTKDNENVNIHLSSHPATIALAFMFMKTHNSYIADQIKLPESISELEKIRPDCIFSRVLAYYLIMWDEIEITDSFVNNSFPKVFHKYIIHSMKFGEDDDNVGLTEDELTFWEDVVDRNTLAQTYFYSVSAACFAIALKFSSCYGPEGYDETKKAMDLFEKYISIVLPAGDLEKKKSYKILCDIAGKNVTSVTLCTLVMCMAIVKVGTGDKTAMRYARMLRITQKIEEENWIKHSRKHHEQVVAHQALGMIFMGGGRYAFKKDNLSIALIAISTYPMVLQSVSENTIYHQPLRFLWTLAAEQRILVPLDWVDRSLPNCQCIITLKRKDKDGNYLKYVENPPCLLPPVEDIISIEIGGGMYEWQRLSITTDEDRRMLTEILTLGHGRITTERVISTEEDQSDINEIYKDGVKNIIDLTKVMCIDEASPLMFDETTFKKAMLEMENKLKLNSAEKYQSIQNYLNYFPEEVKRTPRSLEGIQAANINLMQSIIEDWDTEDNMVEELEKYIEYLENRHI